MQTLIRAHHNYNSSIKKKRCTNHRMQSGSSEANLFDVWNSSRIGPSPSPVSSFLVAELSGEGCWAAPGKSLDWTTTLIITWNHKLSATICSRQKKLGFFMEEQWWMFPKILPSFDCYWRWLCSLDHSCSTTKISFWINWDAISGNWC